MQSLMSIYILFTANLLSDIINLFSLQHELSSIKTSANNFKIYANYLDQVVLYPVIGRTEECKKRQMVESKKRWPFLKEFIPAYVIFGRRECFL